MPASNVTGPPGVHPPSADTASTSSSKASVVTDAGVVFEKVPSARLKLPLTIAKACDSVRPASTIARLVSVSATCVDVRVSEVRVAETVENV